MQKINFRTVLLIGSILVLATGCVSNKKHNREIGVLQSQVNTLASEVSRLDTEVQAQSSKHGIMEAFAPKKPQLAPAVSESYTASAMYKTPSGFELPGADIQRALKTAGYYDGEVDGKIGPKTRDAIRAFQKDNNMKADGVCGRKTWDLLKTHLASSSAIK